MAKIKRVKNKKQTSQEKKIKSDHKMTPEEKEYNKNLKEISTKELQNGHFTWIFYTVFAVSIIAVLFAFLPFAEVYNSSPGVGSEVSINGYNCLMAFFSKEYNSATTGLYGDMAVPFYYYAKSQTVDLCNVAFVSLLVSFITIALTTLSLFFKKYRSIVLSITSVVALTAAIAFFIAFGTGLSMSSAKILSVYCGGNTACSIKSYAIFPGLLMLAVFVGTLFLGIKNIPIDILKFKNNKLLKNIQKSREDANIPVLETPNL